MPPSSSVKETKLRYENEDKELVSSFRKKGYRTSLLLYVNGRAVPEDQLALAQPEQTLLSFLRDVVGLTGSKLGCSEGGCGACTVMISKRSESGDSIEHYSVNACLMPVCAADTYHVTTVEGVGSTGRGKDGMHPIQTQMVKHHGSQCGFCTPGIVVAVYSLFAGIRNGEGGLPPVAHLEEGMDGNLCRCTGYRPIWDAARSLCSDDTGDASGCKSACGKPCPGNSRSTQPEDGGCESLEEDKKESEEDAICSSSTHDKCSGESFDVDFLKQPDDMFRSAMSSHQSELLSSPLLLVGNTSTWFKPTSVDQVLTLLNSFPHAKIVVGNTEVGIETKFKHARFPRYICPAAVPELTGCAVTPTCVTIGACTPLSTVMSVCSSHQSPNHKNAKSILTAIHDMLRWFASTQIRNVACLGGNLVTASPISDMNPVLLALNAVLDVRSSNNARKQPVSNFFESYRTVSLKDGELIMAVEIPLFESKFEYVFPFKQARRREDDISIVTSAMRVRIAVKDNKYVIAYIKLAFGGMAPVPMLASRTEQFLRGKEWCSKTFDSAQRVLGEELELGDNVPGGQAAYRRSLAASFLRKFYWKVTLGLERDLSEMDDGIAYPPVPVLKDDERLGSESFVEGKKPSIRGKQTYPKPRYIPGLEAEGAPIPMARKLRNNAATPHASGALHCTGEAIYVDDMPLPRHTLHGALVLSTKAHCTVTSIDKTHALRIPGVVGVFDHRDLDPGCNADYGPIAHDEELFVSSHVPFVGASLGVVVAETPEAAQEGARAVVVLYEDLPGTACVSIEDALEQESFYEFARHKLEDGDVTEDLSRPDAIVIEGTFRMGGQEHFYLECNTSLVIPTELGLSVFSSTQAPTKTQTVCARAANLPANLVSVRMKRMGGGFGGKETRSWFVSAAAALAAKRTNRPVRLTLDRNVDMSTTGGRHSFLVKYRASAHRTPDGVRLGALDASIYSNGGCSFDLSGPVMDRALFHVDGVYKWSSFRVEGVPCKTIQPPHTAFRGFGGPQGIVICEHVMDRLANVSGVDVDVLRRENMYKGGNVTPFGMVLEKKGWNVPRAWDDLWTGTDFEERKNKVKEFNAVNRWKKRGISMLPTKFGIAFTAKFMNQGGALVHLYTDGSVLVTHGGTEMGQGLHTKVCQVAAEAFQIPLSRVHIEETATDKVANTMPSAASLSTDLYGMCALKACHQILANIAPIREKLGPDASLAAVATAAHFDRIDLSAHGFHTVDPNRCGFDWTVPRPQNYVGRPNAYRGQPFNYFTQGVAVSEVEIDVLTGDHRTVRADVLVDVGSAINPAIDIGQIEGAFVQGMGWCTTEEMIWADKDHGWVQPPGRLFTSGPGTYKIPAFNDTPEEFNVTLMEGVSNPFAVHSSKAIGEPPFFLGCSVYFAIKEAVRAAREENLGVDVGRDFELRLPATSERIRMMCADRIASEGVLPVGVEDGEEEEENRKKMMIAFQPNSSC